MSRSVTENNAYWLKVTEATANTVDMTQAFVDLVGIEEEALLVNHNSSVIVDTPASQAMLSFYMQIIRLPFNN